MFNFHHYLRTILYLILLFGWLGFVFSQDLSQQCFLLSESKEACRGMGSEECRSLLERCAKYYEEESLRIAKDITKTTEQKNTLQNQIAILKKKISALESQIKESNIKITNLQFQIEETQNSIETTSREIEKRKEQIITILRTIYEEDKKPLIEVLLEGNLSDLFNSVVYLENLNSRLNDLLENSKKLRIYLEKQKAKMDTEVDQLQKIIALRALQKKESEANQKEFQQHLKLTESQYQQQLKQKQEIEEKASKIRAMLFELIGVPTAPTFGEALEIAKTAAQLAGIRQAFLLAVISQESAIGRNVGQCYLTDFITGNGKHVKKGTPVIRVMNPTRDVPAFLDITKKLGRDPFATPVSCWIPAYVKGNPVGWGGAMGPAQFIPSTWKKIEPKISSLLGTSLPDPWSIKDSFVAAAVYLAELGATFQTREKEMTAAARYYGIINSSSYASSVMTRANCIQNFIDQKTMSSFCQNLILGKSQ